ncbi:MAG: kelch repeat-containing protein [Gammaproteobacteria bacterium]|jgi:N-acetylneuraminic acid mutarotase|nr:kelch repeat-containing protein [Gammaproteobacteria bacterium]
MNSATDIQAGSWAVKPVLPSARSHCPTATFGGRIYGLGGGGPNFKSLNSVIIYDPQSNTWSRGADMPTLRSGAIALTVGNAIHVIGGGFKQENGTFRFLRTTEIYFPEEDRWEKGPDMIMPHDYPAGIHLDNYIYILGGHHPDATLSGPKTDPGFDFCERLNLDTGEWEQIAPLPTPRFALDAVVMDGRIVTLGGVAFTPEGFNNFDHTEVYDPRTGEWTRGELTLPWTAAGAGACTAGGRPYVFGGYSGDGISDHCAVHDAAANKWHILAPIPQPLAAMGVAVLGDFIYLLGGWADDGRTPQDCCYAYRFR